MYEKTGAERYAEAARDYIAGIGFALIPTAEDGPRRATITR